MKKLIITLAALVVATGAFAQLNFGVKVGGNLSTISGMTAEDADTNINIGGTNLASTDASQSMKLGLNLGVFAEYKVVPMLGVQVEVNYSTQGVNQKLVSSTDLFGGGSSTINTSWSSTYFNIPILAKAHFANIAAYVGPQFGFATSFASASTITTNSKTTEYEPENVEGYSNFDMSIVVGAQYKLTPNIGVDARYNIGLTNVFPTVKNEEGTVTREGSGKQGVLQVGVFYEF